MPSNDRNAEHSAQTLTPYKILHTDAGEMFRFIQSPLIVAGVPESSFPPVFYSDMFIV